MALNSVLSGILNNIAVDFRDAIPFTLKKMGVEDKIIVTDLICTFSYNLMAVFYPFYPFVVLKFVDRLPNEIILAEDLKFPKHGTKVFLSFFVLIIAALSQWIATLYGYFFSIQSNSQIWIISAVGQVFLLIFYSVSLLPIFFMVVWIDKFGQICQDTEGPLIEHAKKCFQNYNSLQEAFGFGFFLIFAHCQFFTFINFFNVISFQFMEAFYTWERVVLSLSFLLVSLHLILIVISITLTCEDGLSSLRSLISPLRRGLGKFKPYSYISISVL